MFLTKRSLHRSHLQNNHILLPYYQIIKHKNIKLWQRDPNIIHCNQASAGFRRGDVALFVQRGQSQVTWKTSPVSTSVYFLCSFNFCSFLSSPSRRVYCFCGKHPKHLGLHQRHFLPPPFPCIPSRSVLFTLSSVT